MVRYGDMPSSDRREIFLIRKEALIDRRGWEIPSYIGGDEEFDQYDDMNSSYMIVKLEGYISGCVRIRSSCIPNITNHDFYWLSGECLSCLDGVDQHSVCEASRFVLRRMTRAYHVKGRVGGIDIRTVMLFHEMIRSAKENSIQYYEIVVDHLMKRVLERVGWCFTVLNVGSGSQGERIFYGLLSCSDVQYENVSLFLDKK